MNPGNSHVAQGSVCVCVCVCARERTLQAAGSDCSNTAVLLTYIYCCDHSQGHHTHTHTPSYSRAKGNSLLFCGLSILMKRLALEQSSFRM